MLISKQIEIDMGHRIPNHSSKCKNFHGHRYRIEVGVSGNLIQTPGDSGEGMVIDFGDLKKIMMEVIDKEFDHSFVMYDYDPYNDFFRDWKVTGDQKINFVNFIPTVENLVKHWFKLLQPKLLEKKIELKYVKAWETPSSTAEFSEEEFKL